MAYPFSNDPIHQLGASTQPLSCHKGEHVTCLVYYIPTQQPFLYSSIGNNYNASA